MAVYTVIYIFKEYHLEIRTETFIGEMIGYLRLSAERRVENEVTVATVGNCGPTQ